MKIELIKFKRGNKAALEEILVGTKKPAAGEPIWEIDNNKIKIGDGINDYKNLPYLIGGADSDNIVIRGWYNSADGKFYKDSSFTELLPFNINKIYIDEASALLYSCSLVASINEYIYRQLIVTASNEKYGLIKLYNDKGTYTDGSMSQAKITELSKGIEFKIDGEELSLINPWKN